MLDTFKMSDFQSSYSAQIAQQEKIFYEKELF